MNILIYYQNPYRTVFLESLAQSFIQKGHTVHLLTICEKGVLHQKMQSLGVTTAFNQVNGNRLFQVVGQLRFLIKYCRKHKIDIVYSHLQFANLIADIARPFIKAPVFPCRHHVDEVRMVANKNALVIDRLVNRLSSRIIVVSNAVKKYMTEKEGVKAGKITVIPLGYNFDLYDKPDPVEVVNIREKTPCHLLLILIARMTFHKRHILALEALNKLVKDGLDVKLLVLDHGAEEKNLRAFVHDNQLQDRVIFTGFLNNTMNYLAAADLLLCPSLIEASNQVVKEAALLQKPAVVCSGIGDFDEYFRHGENGFLVSQENTTEEMYSVIKSYYNRKNDLETMGKKMKKEVLERFDIRNITDKYLHLKNQLKAIANDDQD